jgi:hypothetical protein
MNKSLKKFRAGKKYFLFKNCNLLIPSPPERTSKLQQKSSSLKREHPGLQNMKSGTSKLELSSLLWVILALLDPDPYS